MYELHHQCAAKISLMSAGETKQVLKRQVWNGVRWAKVIKNIGMKHVSRFEEIGFKVGIFFPFFFLVTNGLFSTPISNRGSFKTAVLDQR